MIKHERQGITIKVKSSDMRAVANMEDYLLSYGIDYDPIPSGVSIITQDTYQAITIEQMLIKIVFMTTDRLFHAKTSEKGAK